MGPKPSQPQTGELFGYPLRDHLNLKHPLILLGDRIQWERIDELVADQFKSSALNNPESTRQPAVERAPVEWPEV